MAFFLDPDKRQRCPTDSECIHDAHCRKRTQKCCPSIYGARFCVNVLDEETYLRTLSHDKSSEEETVANFTESVTEIGHPEEPDHYFINFKTHVNEWPERKTVVIIFDFDPNEYNFTSKTTTVALFSWRSHLNFTDEPSYVFEQATTFKAGEFAVEIEAGWQYKFKLGVYDTDGLLGSKLDDLNHVITALENPIELNVVEDLRIESMGCKLILDKTHQCKFTLGLITNRTDSSHPMQYDLELHSCGKYINESLTLKQIDNRKMSATIDMKVCNSKFLASVIVKTTTFSSKGDSRKFISEPQVFNFGLKTNEWCHRSYHSKALDLTHLKFDGKHSEPRIVSFNVDRTAISELSAGMDYDLIFVFAESVFCTCLSDEALQELSFYFLIEEIEHAQFMLSKRCAYQLSVMLMRSSDLNNCRQISKEILVSPFTNKSQDISREVNVQLLSNKFPSNIDQPVSFPGKMELEIWSLNESNPIYSIIVNNTLMPYDKVPFPRRCSDKLFVLIRHEEDIRKGLFTDCASAAYDFDASNWCLQDAEYFKLMSFYKSRQLLIEPCLNPIAMIALLVGMFTFFL